MNSSHSLLNSSSLVKVNSSNNTTSPSASSSGNGKPAKCWIGNRVMIAADRDDGFLNPATILDIKGGENDIAAASLSQMVRYVIKFDDPKLGSTSYEMTPDVIVGPQHPFKTIEDIELKEGQKVFITRNKREMMAIVKKHEINSNQVDVSIVSNSTTNESEKVRIPISEIRLFESRRSARLVNYDMDFCKLAGFAQNSSQPNAQSSSNANSGTDTGISDETSSIESSSGRTFESAKMNVRRHRSRKHPTYQDSGCADLDSLESSSDSKDNVSSKQRGKLKTVDEKVGKLSKPDEAEENDDDEETDATSDDDQDSSESESSEDDNDEDNEDKLAALSAEQSAAILLMKMSNSGKNQTNLKRQKKTSINRGSGKVFQCTFPDCQKRSSSVTSIEKHVRISHLNRPADIDPSSNRDFEEEFYYTEIDEDDSDSDDEDVTSKRKRSKMYGMSDNMNNYNKMEDSSAIFDHVLMARPAHEDPTHISMLLSAAKNGSEDALNLVAKHKQDNVTVNGLSSSVGRTKNVVSLLATQNKNRMQQQTHHLLLSPSRGVHERYSEKTSTDHVVNSAYNRPSIISYKDEGSIESGHINSNHILGSQINTNFSHHNNTTKHHQQRLRDTKKCRRVYGLEKRDMWCTQCKWKKACVRFGNNTIHSTNNNNGIAHSSLLSSNGHVIPIRSYRQQDHQIGYTLNSNTSSASGVMGGGCSLLKPISSISTNTLMTNGTNTNSSQIPFQQQQQSFLRTSTTPISSNQIPHLKAHNLQIKSHQFLPITTTQTNTLPFLTTSSSSSLSGTASTSNKSVFFPTSPYCKKSSIHPIMSSVTPSTISQQSTSPILTPPACGLASPMLGVNGILTPQQSPVSASSAATIISPGQSLLLNTAVNTSISNNTAAHTVINSIACQAIKPAAGGFTQTAIANLASPQLPPASKLSPSQSVTTTLSSKGSVIGHNRQTNHDGMLVTSENGSTTVLNGGNQHATITLSTSSSPVKINRIFPSTSTQSSVVPISTSNNITSHTKMNSSPIAQM